MSALTEEATTTPLAFIYDRRFTPTVGPSVLRLEHCLEYAAELGLEVAGHWVDTGDEAMSDDRRPQFDTMTAAMSTASAAGRSVVCLIHDWHRLSRDANQQAVLRRKVAAAGGHTVTAAGEDDLPPVSRDTLCSPLVTM